MLYAQFYALSTGYIPGTIPPQFGSPTPIESCGDRGVIVLDGRVLDSFNAHVARTECARRGFIGYSLHKGESFTRSQCIKPFTKI